MSYISENLPLVFGDEIADTAYTPEDFLRQYDECKSDENCLNEFGMVEIHTTKSMKKPNIDPVDLDKILKEAGYIHWDRGSDILDMSKLDKLNDVFHDMTESLIEVGEEFEYEEEDIQELRDEVAII